MPIFEYEGKKYRVSDEKLNKFTEEFPDAVTYEERGGKKYRVSAKKYNKFIQEFDGTNGTDGMNVPSHAQRDGGATVQRLESGMVSGPLSEEEKRNIYLFGQKSLQQRVEEARKEAESAKKAANSYAAPWQVNKTEAPEAVARPKQMTPWDVDSSAFESDEEKRIDYVPQTTQSAKDVYNNYANRFALTENGMKLGEELVSIEKGISDQYAKEFLNSDEYKTLLAEARSKAKNAKDKEELDGINKAFTDEVNNAFALKYGDAIDSELQPYRMAYDSALQERYGGQIQREVDTLNKNAQGGIVKDMTAKVDDMLAVAQGGRENRFVGPQMASLRGKSAMTDEERDLYAAKQQLVQAQQLLDKANGASGWKAFADKMEWSLFTQGAQDAEENARLSNVLHKSEKGEQLNEGEQALLDAALTNMTVQAYYSDESNWAYDMGAVTAESIPFMLEMIASPVNALGNALSKRLLNYGMKKFATTASKKGVERAMRVASNIVSRAAVAPAAMTATTSAGHVVAGMQERLNKNYDIVQDGDGRAVAVRNDKNIGVGEALTKSAASTFFENQSEMIFRAFDGAGKFLGRYAEKLVPGKAAEMLSRMSRSKVGELWTDVHNNPNVKGLRNSANIGGIGEEYLEEVYNNFANVGLGEMSIEDATSLETNVSTFLGLVPTQVFFSALGVGGYVAGRRRNNKEIARYRGMLADDVQREVEEAVVAARSSDGGLTDYYMDIIGDNTLAPEQKKARMGYAKALMERDTLDGIEEAKQAEEPTRQEAAMEAGAAAETPEEKHAISRNYEAMLEWKRLLNDEDGQFASFLDMEDREAAMAALEEQGYSDRMQEAFNYWAAMDAYEGMAIGANDRVNEAVADANWQAARRAHVDGRIIEATTGDRRVVHIKRGNLMWNDDGTVNVALSDPVLYAVNEEGKVEMISPRHITAVAERGTLEAQREYNNTTLREQLEKQEADAVELNPNTPPVAPGLTYTDEQGNQMVVTVVAGGQAQVAPVGEAGKEGVKYSYVPVDELRGMISRQLDIKEGANVPLQPDVPSDETGNDKTPVKTAQDEGASTDETQQNVSGEEQNVSEQVQTAIERVPKDEQGNLLYEETDADTAWDAIVEEAEGDEAVAQEAVADIVSEAEKGLKDAEKALKKAKEAKPEVKGAAPTMAERIAAKKQAKANTEAAQKVVDAAKARLDKWKAIAGTVERRNAAMEAENKRQAEEAARQERERMKAEEISRRNAEEADRLMAEEPQNGKERAAQAIGTGEVMLLIDSYKRETGYGDKEVKGMFGIFAGKEKGGKTIEEAAEYLVAEDAQGFFGGDVQEARNAILDVLQGVRKKSELRNYIANQRKAVADEMARAEREAYEEWTMGAYGMTPEEYENHVQMLEESRPSDVAVEEIRAIFAEVYLEEENRLNNNDNGQERISESVEGSNEVLLGEQTDLEGGDAAISEGGQGNEAGLGNDSADAASQEEAGEIKPVGRGAFGNIYDQFRGKAKEAIRFLLGRREGEAVGALHHPEIGEIDLVWGKEGTGKSDGFGLAKLAKYHPEVLDNLQEILDDMHVTQRTVNRVQLESDTHQAAVRLTWDNEKKNWLLTAFEKKNSVSDNTTDTGETSTGGKRNDTATPQNTVSEGKGSESLWNEQGNKGISSEKEGSNEVNVSANRLVSDARYAELRERMRKKLGGQMNIGIDPEILAIGTEMAVYHLEKGARKFVDYAKAMIADLGDAIRPYLKAFYNGARELPEVVDGGLSAEMTDYDEVQKIDVANLGKQVINPVDAAEAIVQEDAVEKQVKVAKERVKNSRGNKRDGGMLGLFDVQEVTDGDLTFTEVKQPKSEKKSTKKGKQSENPSDEKSPVWQYSVYVDKKTGRTTLRRDDVSGVYPIGDARFTVEAASPEEMLDILRNPLNGMQEVLDAVGVTLENKIATRRMNEAVGYAEANVPNEPSALSETHKAFADAVTRDMLEALESGTKPYRSIVDLRKRAQSVGMEVDSEGRTDILLQELVENGLAKAAREVIATFGRNSRTSFDQICKLYDMQPTIGARSSERVKMQQYSTPLPMAWVANRFAMAGKSSGQVLEPTAGNGMLVFTVPVEQVHANELDETRLDNLRDQGFAEVTNQDANKPFSGEYDVLIANPPFGQRIAKEYDGKLIAGLDPQITVNALQSLKDDGRAAIIIGGNMDYADNGSVKGFKPFFTYLYDHYNVKGIVDMDGKLYQKQGTTFPTRMILIEGRRSAEERAQSAVYPPVKDRAIRKAETFEDLYEIVNEIINSKEKTNGTEILRSQGGQLVSVDSQPSGRVDRRGRSEQSATDVEERRRRERRTSKQEGVKTDGGTDVSGGARPDMGTGETRNEPSRNIEGGSRGVSASDVQRVERVGTPTERVGLSEPQSQEKRTLDEGKLPYRPHNTAFSLQSVAPAAMVEAMDKMLAKIEEKHGSIDEFVRSELGYDTIEEAHNALAAEQMDSVAMAIYQMKNGQAMIIGDQTGVGKGRQMAALIRWAVMRGEKPVFITQKADLFSDIYRDLVDVGSGDLRPFIFNSDGAMVDNNGVVVHKPLSSSEMAKVFQSSQLPDGYDFAVLTYSQVNTGDAISQEEAAKAAKESGKRGTKKSKSSKEGKATPKATFLRAIANDNYLFLDESHTAAGSSNTGAYLQSILKTAKAATFASATFAKRPDTMPLYAIRTAMSKAKIDTNELISIIEKGGVTLQEIMSRALTEAGQMVRRERDMSDVRTDWKTITDEATVKRARENYDRTIEAFNAIIRFQEEFVTPMIEELDKEVAAMAETAKVKKGTEKMGVENVPFASKTYNYTKQLMLALKVDAIVDEVVAEIEAGRHPVIALESTMEASIKDYAPGSVIDEPTFSASLLRGLDTVMQYTVTDENGKESHRRYSPAQLGEEGERAYYELQDFIREATSDIFISPLDAIIEGLKQRGYKVGELTGRSSYVERNDEGQVVVRRRTDKDKKRMQREFNNGTLDVLILNKSASTGISLHASSRFSDQRQRSMIIAQPLSDINDYMQMIGRIDRTGQVHRGYYINLGLPVPAENRFLMMLSTKLKSLNANTTTSQDSESNDVEAPDLLNKYGSKVVVEYLRDNKGIYEKMGDPLKSGKGRVSSSELDEYVPQEDDARKITGYVALLSTSEQDAFYDDVVRRYKELIKYLDDTGSNDLKITVMPLRAQTIEKRVSSEGIDPNGENPFASNAYVERVEMDVLRKPMKASEVQAVMESLAKGEEPTAHVKSIAATVRQEVKEKLDAEDVRYERAKERMAENVEKQAAKINGQKKLTDEQKRSSIERVREEERERVELQHNEAVKRIGLTRDNFLQRLNMFRVGNTYMVPDNLETPTFMFSSPAIFCGYKAKDSNLTPSTTLAVFATLDGRRRVEVKLSEINPLRVISDATSNNWDTVSRTNLDTWDSMRPTSTRKEGYIMTGNILQAVADTKDENGHYPGQLISFTDMEGNVRDGILMPDKWDTSQLKSGNVPLNARMAQIKAGNWVESHDGKVSLSKGYGSSYHVTVPKTKKSGGAYYLNEDLLDLVDGHVFYPWRGEFRADIPAENIEKAVNILSNLGVKVKGETGKEETRFREGEGEMTDRDVVMQSDMYSAFLGKPRYSGKRMRDYVARQRGKMVDRVKDMAKKMGVEVTIINSVADAPKDVKRILRKHPNAKGWYDVATGKVVVIMPNHGSIEDVTSTVLHECVAHYGLRKLFGKRFDKFLDNVYMNADPDVFKRISELAQKNGWDYRVATEEYLASLAEDTNFENARNSGWFQRIKDFFIDMMHALGFDDIVGASLSDNELRYILWRSYENMVRPGSYLNKFAEAGDMSMQKRLKVGDYQALVDIQRLGNVDLSEYVPMAAEERVVGDDGLRFRFIGKHGAANLDKFEEATTRLDNLAVAREMEEAKKDAKTIKMATGWERGSDGKWRYEVEDIDISETEKKLSNRLADDDRPHEEKRASAIVYSDEISSIVNAYPEWNVDIMVNVGEMYDNTGVYKPGYEGDEYHFGYSPSIEINAKSVADVRRLLAHEIQHAIQEIEGFAEGGNLSTVNEKIEDVKYYLGINKNVSINNLVSYLENGLQTPQQDKALTKLANEAGYENAVDYVKSLNPLKYYRRLSGEVEARNVESRLSMSEEERRASLAAETEDVERADQIFLNGALGGATMFREITDPVIQKAVDAFEKRYNAAPVEELPSDREEMIAFAMEEGYSREEAEDLYNKFRNTKSSYISVDDKIYIFAGRVSEDKVEEALIHENVHRAISQLMSEEELQVLADALYKLNPKLGEKIRKSPDYKEEDFNEEMIAYSLQLGHRNGMQKYLGELAENEQIKNILNFIDYDGRRKNSIASETGTENAVLAETGNTGTSDSRGKNGRRNRRVDTRQAGVAQSDDGRYPGRENLILDEIVRLEEDLGTSVNAIDSFDALPEGRAKDAIAEGRKVLGWYQDGRVYVYMPNARSAGDVRATVYHEVVGHLGLRELLGDRFNAFLDRVYMNLPADVRADLNGRALRKNWDFREATEEYMAELAERFARGEKVSGLRKVLYAVRDAVVKALRSLGIDLGFEMSDNYLMYVLWSSKQNLKPSNVMGRIADLYMRNVLNVEGDVVSPTPPTRPTGTDGADGRVAFREVTDKEALDFLNGQETMKAYRAMQVIDGKLYPPMSAKVEGKLRAPIELGKWEEAEERPDLADERGYFKLDKANKSSLKARYNPYIHTSLTPLNDQFSSAQERPNLVTVEVEIPVSELTSGYKADKAKDSVGKVEWKAGVVQSQLTGTRTVILSRWDKPMRIVPESEVADRIVDMFGDKKVLMPSNVVTPQLRTELEKRGVPFVETDNQGKRIKDDGLRFREIEPEDDATRMTREAYEKNLKSLGYRMREGFQDSMLALKELQEAIVKTLGHDLEEYEDAYVEENHLSSKNTAEFDYLTRKLYKPLIEVVHELMKGGNMSYQGVLDYMNAKHGIERNRDWAVRDALNAMRKEAEDDAQRQVVDDMEQSYYDYRDAMYEELENGYIDFDQYCDLMDAKARDYVPGYDGKEDYSGLSSVFGEAADVDAEWYDRARGYVRNVEDTMPDVTEKLWEAVRSVNQFSLDKAKGSGTMSVADHQKISNQFKWYVPLRGFDETTAEEAYEYFSRDSATGAYQSTIKKGRGRKSQAADMIATMMNVTQSTIMHGNKNLMKQKFLNLVMNSKTGLVTVLDNWYVNTGTVDDPIWKPAYPEFKPEDTAEEIAQAIDDFKADMEAKEQQGLAKKARGGERIPYRTTKKSQLDEHIVIAKRNGQEFRMVLNGNPRAAQALNGLTNPDTAEGTLEKIAHKVNPILAPLFTTQNPTFIARNLIRDSIMSGSSVMMKESFWYGQRFRGNQLRSLGNIGSLIKKYNAGALDESVPMERYFKEFIENGAETGYSQLWSVDKFKAEIEKDLKRMEGGFKNGTINSGKALLDGLAFVNRCAENMNRFAVYMTSRESGRSIQRSVHDAKEITVNFNKKGAGAKAGGWVGEAAQIARTFYLFFNAGIQGLNNYASMAKEHPMKFAGVVGLFGGMGALMPLVNALMIAMFGDDDDKDTYNDLPEWVRRNNICLFVPFAGNNGTVITLPLPIELRAIYGLGEAVMQINLGHESKKDALQSVTNQFFEMMPINPVSSGGVVQAFTPTAFQPIVQHVQNKDWTGAPIYKETDFNKRYPEYTQAYKGTPKLLVQISKWLNDLTGGNEVKRGWWQMNPGLASNYISGYTGGVGTTLMDIEKSIEMFFDEPFDLRNIPVVKAVAQTPTERNKYSTTNAKYYELVDELKQFKHEENGYKRMVKEGGEDASKYMELYKELHDTVKVRRMEGIEEIGKQLKELKEMDNIIPADSLLRLENELRKQAVELYGER